MKRLLIFVLAMSGVGLSQTSAVSATITDPDSQTWNNGSYTISFVPTPGIPGPYTWQGNPNFPTNYTGTFSGSGLLAVSIPDNSFIAPLGSKWQFTLCSNTSAPCQNVTLSVTGVAPNLSAALSGPLVAPRFGAGQFAFGYLDIEVTGTLAPGNFYFNVTNLIQRIWNGSTWVNNAGGGGGTITGSGTANSFTGWNGPTSLSNAPAIFSGTSSTFGGSVTATACAGCTGALQITGNTVVPTSLPATGSWGFLGFSSAGPTSYFFQPNSTPPTAGQVLAAGTPATCVGSSATCIPLNYLTPASGIPIPGNAQNGDTIRFNVNGDSAWDAVNAALKTGVIYAFITNTNTQLLGGGVASSPTTLGTAAGVTPTATDSSGFTLTSAASTASTNSIIGFNEGGGTSWGRYGFGSFYRWSWRFAAGQTTNVRYWFGLCVFNNLSGSGAETQAQLGTAKFANDAPNVSTIGYRFSSTTDTTWKGITQVTGGSQTVVNTSLAIDTSPHTYEFTYDGTTVRFFVDNALVGTSTTNIPATSTVFVVQFMTGDNKNTANAVSATTYHVLYSIK